MVANYTEQGPRCLADI